MTVMAIGADGGAEISLSYCFRMNAFAIGKKRPVTDTASLHDRFVSMTTTASIGDVCAINRGARVTRCQDRRHIAVLCVAVETSCSPCAIDNCLVVKAVVVVCVWTSMKE